MANSKISALTSATTPLAGTEVVAIVQSSATKQVSVANLTAGRAVSTGALTTSGKIVVNLDGAVGLRLNNTTGGAGQGVEMLTAATKKSWLLGAQYNIDQAFEITPSTTNGGTTFTTPAAVFTDTSVYPGADNTSSSGTSGKRWSVVYAATGTINTSDASQKQQIRHLTKAEHAVAIRLKSLIRAFKFNDAVAKKGAAARIHIGVIAQDVRAAFDAEGLDPADYGVFCVDVATNGVEQLSIRYEELFAFVLSTM